MLWENSSVAAVAAAAVARPDLEMGSSRVLLRNRRFRSARIDPSRRAVAEGYMYIKKHRKKNQISKTSWKRINNGREQA